MLITAKQQKELLLNVSKIIQINSTTPIEHPKLESAAFEFCNNLISLLDDGLKFHDAPEPPKTTESVYPSSFFSTLNSFAQNITNDKPEQKVHLSLFEVVKKSIIAHDPALWQTINDMGIGGGVLSLTSITSNFSAASKAASETQHLILIFKVCLVQQLLTAVLTKLLEGDLNLHYNEAAYVCDADNRVKILEVVDGLKSLNLNLEIQESSRNMTKMPSISDFGMRIFQGGEAALTNSLSTVSGAYNSASTQFTKIVSPELTEEQPSNDQSDLGQKLAQAQTAVADLEKHVIKLQAEKMEMQLELVKLRKEKEPRSVANTEVEGKEEKAVNDPKAAMVKKTDPAAQVHESKRTVSQD